MLRRLSIMGTLSEVYITHFAKLVYITGLHKIFSGKALDFGYYVKMLCKLPRIRRKCELSHYFFKSEFWENICSLLNLFFIMKNVNLLCKPVERAQTPVLENRCSFAAKLKRLLFNNPLTNSPTSSIYFFVNTLV